VAAELYKQWNQRNKKQKTELDKIHKQEQRARAKQEQRARAKQEQRARANLQRPELVFNCEVIDHVSEAHRRQPSCYQEGNGGRNFAYAEDQVTGEPWSQATSRPDEAAYSVTFPDNTVVPNVLGRKLEPLRPLYHGAPVEVFDQVNERWKPHVVLYIVDPDKPAHLRPATKLRIISLSTSSGPHDASVKLDVALNGSDRESGLPVQPGSLRTCRCFTNHAGCGGSGDYKPKFGYPWYCRCHQANSEGGYSTEFLSMLPTSMLPTSMDKRYDEDSYSFLKKGASDLDEIGEASFKKFIKYNLALFDQITDLFCDTDAGGLSCAELVHGAVALGMEEAEAARVLTFFDREYLGGIFDHETQTFIWSGCPSNGLSAGLPIEAGLPIQHSPGCRPVRVEFLSRDAFEQGMVKKISRVIMKKVCPNVGTGETLPPARACVRPAEEERGGHCRECDRRRRHHHLQAAEMPEEEANANHPDLGHTTRQLTPAAAVMQGDLVAYYTESFYLEDFGYVTDLAKAAEWCWDQFYLVYQSTSDDLEAFGWQHLSLAACVVVGLAFRFGHPWYPQNASMAYKCFHKAADSYVYAQLQLIDMYLRQQEIEPADAWSQRKYDLLGSTGIKAWYNPSSQLNHPGVKAWYAAGGVAAPKLKDKTVSSSTASWYSRRAAVLGHASTVTALGWCEPLFPPPGIDAQVWNDAQDGISSAQLALGRAHQKNFGDADINLIEAVKWFTKAALQGNSDAQQALGRAYALGIGGLQRNETKAIEMFEAAAAKNVNYAWALAETFMNTLGCVGYDYDKAEAWYAAGALCTRGGVVCSDAQREWTLGDMYSKGLGGLAKDEAKAEECYQRSAHADHFRKEKLYPGKLFEHYSLGTKEYELGRKCELGEGVSQDAVKAAVWYKASAFGSEEYKFKSSNRNAKYQLALLYEEGRGVERDVVAAVELYQELASHHLKIRSDDWRYKRWLQKYASGRCLPRIPEIKEDEALEGYDRVKKEAMGVLAEREREAAEKKRAQIEADRKMRNERDLMRAEDLMWQAEQEKTRAAEEVQHGTDSKWTQKARAGPRFAYLGCT
jgi:TPR repeat protein